MDAQADPCEDVLVVTALDIINISVKSSSTMAEQQAETPYPCMQVDVLARFMSLPGLAYVSLRAAAGAAGASSSEGSVGPAAAAAGATGGASAAVNIQNCTLR
jgi:hypothetical protein